MSHLAIIEYADSDSYSCARFVLNVSVWKFVFTKHNKWCSGALAEHRIVPGPGYARRPDQPLAAQRSNNNGAPKRSCGGVYSYFPGVGCKKKKNFFSYNTKRKTG